MKQAKTNPVSPAAYVNLFRVGHQRSEFFLQFGLVLEQHAPRGHLVSSLVTSPAHAKSMLRALGEAVARYEQDFGEIAETEPDGSAAAASRAPESDAAKPPRGAKARSGRKKRARSAA